VQMTRYIDAAKELESNILLMNVDVDKGITTLRLKEVNLTLPYAFCCVCYVSWFIAEGIQSLVMKYAADFRWFDIDWHLSCT
jgi:hypothetical protein